MTFPNPYPDVLPNRVWHLLLLYFERRSCFRSGWRPQSNFKHVQYVTRRGNLAWREEGPFPAEVFGTAAQVAEFGDKVCDEVAGCYLKLDARERLIVELTVLGVVLDQTRKLMRAAAKDMGITMRWVWKIRQKAFKTLAKACEEKGIS